MLLLAILALLLSRGITHGEPYYFNDETRHVMNGAFVRDLLADRPLDDPLRYAYEYYAKYPATALPHWPPLFPMLEGILFLAFGLHFWVARLLVLGFALMGAYYWYRIAEGEGPIYRAWFSALLVFTLPFIQLYSSIVMLEIPLLGLSMGAIYYWRRFQKEGAAGHLWLMAAFVVASFLTSQKAIFLAVFVILSFAIQGPYRMLARWDVWAAFVASVSLVLPWYYFTHRTLSVGMDRAIGLGAEELARRWSRHFLFYPERIPQQMGWVLFALAVAGLGWAVLRAPRRYAFFTIWIVSCYITFTLIWEKDTRHAMIWLPPLVYFAILAIEILCVGRRWTFVVCATLAVTMVVGAVGFQRPMMEGVTDVARFILSQPDSDIIYYQGSLNGS
ncbi:MAG: ArnT family glycosyltransferase, partial [Candidatus Acidiferrales bacterium]